MLGKLSPGLSSWAREGEYGPQGLRQAWVPVTWIVLPPPPGAGAQSEELSKEDREGASVVGPQLLRTAGQACGAPSRSSKDLAVVFSWGYI